MKTLSIVAVVVTALILSTQTVSAHCGSCKADVKENAEKVTPTCQKAAEKAADIKIQKLCLKCGQVKGSEECCKPGQTLCKGCGLVKGSPGCCKIPKGAKKAYYCPKTKKVVTSKADCPYLKGKAAKKIQADCSSGGCPLSK